MLRHSHFIIGNSSTGIRESEIYEIPSINIGSRQHNRHNHDGIIDVDYDPQNISEAIKKIKSFSVSPTNYFGDGYNTSDMFIQILNNEDLWKISTQKYFVD